MHAETFLVTREAPPGASDLSDHPGNAISYRRGRKTVVTPERQALICELLTKGETEEAACVRAGIGKSAWCVAKAGNADLRARIARARDVWAKVRHLRYMAARRESQWQRSATRKAAPETPTKSARFVMWRLIRLPLNFVTIPENEMAKACEESGLTVERWRQQEAAFGLMRQVYDRRAKIRGKPTAAQAHAALPVIGVGWQTEYVEDEYSRFRP